MPEGKKNLFDDVGRFLKKAADGAGEVAGSVGNSISTAASSIAQKGSQIADINGDGKVDENDIQALLDTIYGYTTNGIPKIDKPVSEYADEYLKRHKDVPSAAKDMISKAIIKCTTSGFVTGFGGVITLPVTLPANVTSVLYVQMRMIAAVAYMAGWELDSDATRTFVYACLAGVSVADIVKQAGIKIGVKMTTGLVKKIPGKALTKINQKVGFRLLTKFGSTGIINVGKMVPVVGAVIGGSFDLAETKIIADRAYKEFIEHEFPADAKDEIVVEMNDLDNNQ